jgi:hypothetical protein
VKALPKPALFPNGFLSPRAFETTGSCDLTGIGPSLREFCQQEDDSIPNEDRDHNRQQSRRNLFPVLLYEIVPTLNDFCIRLPVAALIRNRNKAERSWEKQSDRQEPLQYRANVLPRRCVRNIGKRTPQEQIGRADYRTTAAPFITFATGSLFDFPMILSRPLVGIWHTRDACTR